MVAEITCPRCGRPALPQMRYCEHCGVDLGIAAALDEERWLVPLQVPSGVPLAPEILVPRLGDYMIEQGWLKPEDLQKALSYQKERASKGEPILVGQALLELNLTTREMLDQGITAQIVELQNALSSANKNLQQRVQERTRELQRALERLSELNYLKSNFIANISHELRTPLTHIKGYLDLLSEGGLGPLTMEQSEALAVLNRSEMRLERLIEDLIQFSLASRGELNLDLQTFAISQIIRIVVDRSRHQSRSKKIQLEMSLPNDLPWVRADQDKIGWVLLQLLDNAIKFTPQGGRVIVQAKAEPDGPVTVAVIDTGIGIPHERLTEVFEPFHQLDGSTTRRYGGTGLGLAMVRRIVEAHGSQVRVESAVDHGSRFEFDLPAAPNSGGLSSLAGVYD
jgi:signal transduction histidine kinase